MDNSIAHITGDSLNKCEKWIADRAILISLAEKIETVENEIDLQASGAVQTKISKHVKALAKERLDFTRPLDDVKKDIMAQEKIMVQELNIHLARLKRLNNDLATKMEAERQAEARRRQAEFERQRLEAAERQAEADRKAKEILGENATGATVEPPPPPKPVEIEKPKLTTNRQVVRYEFRVVNPDLVPVEYKTVDEKKIRAHIANCKAMDRTPDLPGVYFEKRVSVESR